MISRAINITSARDALNGYQKGTCFYSGLPISLTEPVRGCSVDHFIPHAYKRELLPANINGVWNLVLTDTKINIAKGKRVPTKEFLEKLYQRNEYYIESKHPHAETIINQTGKTSIERQRFLNSIYNRAIELSIHKWNPSQAL